MWGGGCGLCGGPPGFTGAATGPVAIRLTEGLVLRHQQQVGGRQEPHLRAFQQTPEVQYVGCAMVV